MSIGSSWKEETSILGQKSEKDSLQKSVEGSIKELNDIYSESPVPLKWLVPFGFEDNWEIVMLRREAEKEGIVKISDLVKRLNGQLRLGCDYEFFGRAAGYGVLTMPKPNGYGLRFKEEKFYRHAQVYEKLSKGEVDIINGLTTDPALEDEKNGPFMIVKDDQDLQGKYFSAILARRQFIEQNSKIEEALKVLRKRIDIDKMRGMIQEADRARVGDMKAIGRIALQFLYSEDLLRKGKSET